MTAKVQWVKWWGKKAISLQGEGLEALLIPELGGNLVSLRHVETDQAILRTPDTWDEYQVNPYLCGIPVLFPPNRIADGLFSYGGHTYRFPVNEEQRGCHLHGFAHNRNWRVLEAAVVQGCARVVIAWSTSDFADVLKQFPHVITLRITYELREGALWQTTDARNDGDTEAPFGLGFHTTFPLPFQPSHDPARCRVALPVGEQWELNDRLLPTGKLLTLANKEEWRKGKVIHAVALDDVFTAEPEIKNIHTAVLTDDESGKSITYTTYGPINHWVIYNRDGYSGYVCIEPYTWVTNAPNLDMPAEQTGFRTLAKGETLQVVSSIALHTI